MKYLVSTLLAAGFLLGTVVGCGGTGKTQLPEKAYTPDPKVKPTGSATPPPILK
jgi:hypothetical protein